MESPGNEIQLIDHRFWRVAVKDDEQAFRELFFDFFPSLCVFARRYIESRETCEDIVQETFFRIWKNRKSIEINSSFRNFLITSVKNSCIDYLRKQTQEQNYIAKQQTEALQNIPTEEVYTIQELEDAINQALSKLPENIRQVFEKNRFENMTYNEIASHYDISVKTVESYINKALKVLRKELKDYLPFITLFLY